MCEKEIQGNASPFEKAESVQLSQIPSIKADYRANYGQWVGREDTLDLLDWVVCCTIVVCLCLALYAGLAGNIFRPLVDSIAKEQFSAAFLRPSMLWAIIGASFLIFRTFLWLLYRPFPSATHSDAPPLTVIIPAYNEGAMVEQSIYSVLSADYPQDKLEVFVVDDTAVLMTRGTTLRELQPNTRKSSRLFAFHKTEGSGRLSTRDFAVHGGRSW